MALKILGKVNNRTSIWAKKSNLTDKDILKLLVSCLVLTYFGYSIL